LPPPISSPDKNNDVKDSAAAVNNSSRTTAVESGSVKDMAKNMNFGFLGKSREQMLLDKK